MRKENEDMIFKNFKGKQLSALGLGAMRFPLLDENSANIDFEATSEMVAYAMANGINYYDTAWGYHGGNSEPVIGEILSKYPRESFCLATKFPGFDKENMSKVAEIFEKQLERCRTDYFDFYLCHCVAESNIEEYLDEKYGVVKYLAEQKKNGRIKHLGFSTHGSFETMKRFLDAYRDDMEFCQIQLNWLDWELQRAKEKVELLKQYNMPIWVMEPVRGGKLAAVEAVHEEKLTAYRDEKVPAWAFRFIQTIPGVVVTLSGMSNMEQLKDNIATFQDEKPLTEEEKSVLLAIGDEIASKTALPCTACNYCTAKCPMDLAIPKIIEVYNKKFAQAPQEEIEAAMAEIPTEKQPTSCVGCRACEEVCPQQIKISEMMRKIKK